MEKITFKFQIQWKQVFDVKMRFLNVYTKWIYSDY